MISGNSVGSGPKRGRTVPLVPLETADKVGDEPRESRSPDVSVDASMVVPSPDVRVTSDDDGLIVSSAEIGEAVDIGVGGKSGDAALTTGTGEGGLGAILDAES